MDAKNIKKNIETGSNLLIQHIVKIKKDISLQHIQYVVKLMDDQFVSYYENRNGLICYYTLEELINFILTVQYPISWIDQTLYKLTNQDIVIEIVLVYKHYEDDQNNPSFHVSLPSLA
jgi:hypothetical protein